MTQPPPDLTAILHPWISKTVAVLMLNQQIGPDDVADALGVNGPTYRHRMAGRRAWTVDNLVALSHLFGEPIDRLCNGLDGLVEPPDVHSPRLHPARMRRHAPMAQLAAQRTFNPKLVGRIPVLVVGGHRCRPISKVNSGRLPREINGGQECRR